MVLTSRPITVSVAVMFFFGLSFVGLCYGQPIFTCCMRACMGAVLAYIITVFAVRAINAILTNAMIEHHINRARGKDRAAGN